MYTYTKLKINLREKKQQPTTTIGLLEIPLYPCLSHLPSESQLGLDPASSSFGCGFGSNPHHLSLVFHNLPSRSGQHPQGHTSLQLPCIPFFGFLYFLGLYCLPFLKHAPSSWLYRHDRQHHVRSNHFAAPKELVVSSLLGNSEMVNLLHPSQITETRRCPTRSIWSPWFCFTLMRK